MTPKKRALLIGSSYKGSHELPGAPNDVKIMLRVLKLYGFPIEDESLVKTLCGSSATRERILGDWQELRDKTGKGDIVVIYYSGHGAMVDPDITNKHKSRIQFLVPYDFDASLETWNGILDSEISQLLKGITSKTKNVTFILDCCHSARLGRNGAPGISGRPKALDFPISDYSKISKHAEQLRSTGRLLEDDNWINPHVLRISAAAADEVAWEMDSGGYPSGVLTSNLALLMNNPAVPLSWRTLMLAVSARVEQRFGKDEKPQQPRSAGPDNRYPFSTESMWSRVFLAKTEEDYTAICGGRVHGISEGDTFKLVPIEPPQEGPVPECEVEVNSVNGFSASALAITEQEHGFPSNLAYAFPCKRSHRWPILFPSNLPYTHAWLDHSSYFRECRPNEKYLVEFQHTENQVVLRSQTTELGRRNLGDSLTLEDAIIQLFPSAEAFAQAQYIVALESGDDEETLRSSVEFEIGKEINTKKHPLLTGQISEPGHERITIADSQRIYIRFDNKSKDTAVYVSVLSIDGAGITKLVSRAWEKGIPLSPSMPIKILAERSSPLKGLRLDWPQPVPKPEPIEETLVIVVTGEEVDLRILETSGAEDDHVARGIGAASWRSETPYQVAHIRYNLSPS